MADKIKIVDRNTRVRVLDKRTHVRVVAGGPQGLTGPPGPPGAGGVSYMHDQVVASATWTIAHNLAQFPSVTTVDTAGTVIHGGVVYNNNNQITVTFSTPLSGKAYLS